MLSLVPRVKVEMRNFAAGTYEQLCVVHAPFVDQRAIYLNVQGL